MKPRAWIDVAVALVLATFAQIEIWYPRAAPGVGAVHGNKAVLVPTALAMTLPVAFRLRWPLVAAIVVMVSTALQSVLTTPTEGLAGLLAGLLVLYTVAAHADLMRAAVGAATAFAAVVASSSGAGDVGFGILIYGAAWLAGLGAHRRQARAAGLEIAAERLREERDTAILEERRRLARELHDVVAHSVSTIVVQAEAGDALLDRDPAAARASLAAIEANARQALVELRRMLGLLRDDATDADVAPQPRLAELDALIDGVRRAGLSVSIRTEGHPTPLPPGLDLAAYRIVQEALTNALKHGGPTRADVTVRYGTETLGVEVRNEGAGAGGRTANGRGHGLIGMRERVALYSGELETTASPDGGFAVRAELPLSS